MARSSSGSGTRPTSSAARRSCSIRSRNPWCSARSASVNAFMIVLLALWRRDCTATGLSLSRTSGGDFLHALDTEIHCGPEGSLVEGVQPAHLEDHGGVHAPFAHLPQPRVADQIVVLASRPHGHRVRGV